MDELKSCIERGDGTETVNQLKFLLSQSAFSRHPGSQALFLRCGQAGN